MDGRGDAIEEDVAGMGQDGGDAGPDGVAQAHRGLADPHAGDIGDRVQRSRWERAGDDAEIAGARGVLGVRRRGHEQGKQEEHRIAAHGVRMEEGKKL